MHVIENVILKDLIKESFDSLLDPLEIGRRVFMMQDAEKTHPILAAIDREYVSFKPQCDGRLSIESMMLFEFFGAGRDWKDLLSEIAGIAVKAEFRIDKIITYDAFDGCIAIYDRKK